MNAADLIRYVSDALFVVVFLGALAAAVRERRRPLVDAALLFGALALVLVQGEIARALGVTPPPVVGDVAAAKPIDRERLAAWMRRAATREPVPTA